MDEWKLTTVGPQERSTLRSDVRSAMPAASQLLGGGPLMWMMPLHLHVNYCNTPHYNMDMSLAGYSSLFYDRHIQKNYRKITMQWSFSYNSSVPQLIF